VNHCQPGNRWPTEVGQLVCEFSTEGRIVSVYDKAANILVPPGLLVSLVQHPGQMTPMSVKCPALFERLRSRQVKLKVGDTARISRGRLTVGNQQIDLKAARCFQGIPEHSRVGRFKSETIAVIRRVLCMVGRRGGLLGLIDESEADNPFVRQGLMLRDGLIGSRQSRMIECLAKFVGLGVGFTPSGDDLICGFLLGKKVVALSDWNGNPDRQEMKYGPLNAKEKRRIWKEAARTNAGGRTLIWMALQGRFPGFLLDAVAGLSRSKGSAGIFRAVNTAVSRGHTSGTDALVGLLLYLQRLSQDNKIVTGFELRVTR